MRLHFVSSVSAMSADSIYVFRPTVVTPSHLEWLAMVYKIEETQEEIKN